MKGVIQTVEAVLGVVIVLVGISLIYPIREKEEIELTNIGYNCLRSLDQQGSLEHYVSNNLVNDLNNSLRNCITDLADFTFKICDSASCNPDYVPLNKPIFVSGYLVSGYENYGSKLVNVWMWVK